jgi:putative hydrolase
MRARRCDFHMHTSMSDGELLPMELIRRAAALDHRAVALTDHASFSNLDWIVQSLAADCKKADAWGIEAIPGVELTHIPVRYIDEAVRKSRKMGAEIIVVHGETPVEPVERGTNDIDEAELAAKNDVILEITCRKGHSLANGHVAAMAREVKATMLVNTDTHSPSDLSTMAFAHTVARGSGLTPEEVREALVTNPERLLKRLKRD